MSWKATRSPKRLVRRSTASAGEPFSGADHRSKLTNVHLIQKRLVPVTMGGD
jgi:hypothetical protein